jgi:hypothetical protein
LPAYFIAYLKVVGTGEIRCSCVVTETEDCSLPARRLEVDPTTHSRLGKVGINSQLFHDVENYDDLHVIIVNRASAMTEY